MNIMDYVFKNVLDNFFTKERCNNWSKKEKDFQIRLAKYLAGKEYMVLREVVVTKEDVPALKKELDHERILIDIVAYKEGCFYPIELKFENIIYQSEHVTAKTYDDDWDKLKLVFKHYYDIPVAFRRILTNNSNLRKDIDGTWKALKDGQEGEKEFMWQGDKISEQDYTRDPKHTFAGIWNKEWADRYEDNKFKEGDNAKYVAI